MKGQTAGSEQPIDFGKQLIDILDVLDRLKGNNGIDRTIFKRKRITIAYPNISILLQAGLLQLAFHPTVSLFVPARVFVDVVPPHLELGIA
jgi:hypothetical protein